MRYNTLSRLIILALLLLTACSQKSERFVNMWEQRALQARALYQAGNFHAAAEAYLSLAKIKPAEAMQYRFNAIDAFILAENFGRAQSILDDMAQVKLSPVQTLQRHILLARVAVAENAPEAALRHLNLGLPKALPRPILNSYYATKAEALLQKQEYFAAAAARARLGSYLDDERMIKENNQKLWEIISQLSLAELGYYLSREPTGLNSWLELSVISKTTLHDVSMLQAEIESWQVRYPNHPALEHVTGSIILLSKQLAKPPAKIALLLPFSGKYKQVASIIRDGFLAAWYEAEDARPVVKIYDVNAENILEMYDLAVTEGAEFVVGPLQKEVIGKLVKSGNLSVSTMLLNQYDERTDKTLENQLNQPASPTLPVIIQFGLPPEDEVNQVAEQAWLNGQTRAIIIASGNPKDDRVKNAFISRWQVLGGNILAHADLDQTDQELNTIVKWALNIDQSEQRSNNLRNRLQRNLHTEIRRRQDVDLVFMVVPPVVARRLVPQLQYYLIDEVAMYSVSGIYAGVVNERADADLNNVLFVDMPWVIDPEQMSSPLQQMIDLESRAEFPAYRRFSAFGIDAYRLVTQAKRLLLQPTYQYNGVSGMLRIDRQKQVRRRLVWGRFVDGRPHLLNPVGLN